VQLAERADGVITYLLVNFVEHACGEGVDGLGILQRAQRDHDFQPHLRLGVVGRGQQCGQSLRRPEAQGLGRLPPDHGRRVRQGGQQQVAQRGIFRAEAGAQGLQRGGAHAAFRVRHGSEKVRHRVDRVANGQPRDSLGAHLGVGVLLQPCTQCGCHRLGRPAAQHLHSFTAHLGTRVVERSDACRHIRVHSGLHLRAQGSDGSGADRRLGVMRQPVQHGGFGARVPGQVVLRERMDRAGAEVRIGVARGDHQRRHEGIIHAQVGQADVCASPRAWRLLPKRSDKRFDLG
jgi:hypothetical protein